MNQSILRFLEPLFRHQFFFIELFAGTQTGILDLDVLVRFKAGKLDEVPCQRIDLDGTAHIEHKDLAALGIGARQQNQTDRLRNGHKVADDIRMRHGDRAASCNLLFEQRNHGPVASQNVAESDGDKLGFRISRDPFDSVRFAVFLMRRQIRDFICFACFNLPIKALNDHFAKTFARTHDIGWIDGFVCGNQHKTFAAVRHGGVCRFIGAERVVLNGFARAVLHERNMFVRRRMVNDLRLIGLEHLENTPAVTNGADQNGKIEVRISLAQFHLNIVRIVLIDIEDDQLLRTVRGDLPTEFAADGAAAAGDKNALPVDKTKYLIQIRSDRSTAQKVLDGNVLHRADRHLTRDQLIQTGKLFELAVRFAADVQNIPLILCRCAGNCQEDLVNMILLDIFQNIVAPADNRNAFKVSSLFIEIVVDDADNLVLRIRRKIHVLQQHLSRIAGADQHHAIDRFGVAFQRFPAVIEQSVCKPDRDQKRCLQKQTAEIIG